MQFEMMRIHQVMSLILIRIFLMIIAFNINGVKCSCPSNHQSLLLHLKNNLKFNPSDSKKLVQWNENMNCCQWNGVTCNEGQVTGLDLSQESINGGINDSSCIFSLQYLKTLNLAFNNFNTEFPSGFHKLKNLRYLNLSNAGFVGNVPILISQLTKLVILDLSTSPFNELHISDLAMLIHNLSEITELFLDGISLQREDYWSHAISSSLSKLRVLSLSNCNLNGPIDSSLERFHSLSVIDLSNNNLSGPVPEFFSNFENLTKLNLYSNSFTGRFPEKIFQLKSLVFLDISSNLDLIGSLPDFHQNSSLQSLIISVTGLSGQLPNSISNLRQLSWLDLRLSHFNGSISTSLLSNLAELVYLDLSCNNFNGKIPSFGMLKKLTYLDLSANSLTDTIPSNHFEGLINLVDIVLEKNSFRGKIPSSMFMLPSLRHILLSNNHFEGQLSDVHVITNGFPSELLELDLSSNNLEGDIPMSIFELKKLRSLKLSSNKFSGQIDLNVMHKLRNLTLLDLSNNNLSVVETSTIGSTTPSFPSLISLNLASCRLTSFPKFLRNQSSLSDLDLSNNHIGGSIPYWIWINSSSVALNLSHNFFTGWEHYYHENSNFRLLCIDVHDNYLQGSLPVLPPFANYIDFSQNYFSSLIPPNIGDFLAKTSFLSLSRNNFHGSIPESLCNASDLGILDLSMNSLTGTIPKCLISGILTFRILNLRRNKLTGRIDTYPGSCNLESIDLNSNFLQGEIPKYFANCSMLEVLDLGNNQINDQFPCWLLSVSSLRVLILRSNKLHGSLQCPQTNASSWPLLQILDIASNNLSGRIPPTFFENWKGMMSDQGEKKNLQHDQIQNLVITQSDYDVYYHDSVTVTSKSMQMELVKILTIFTAIDMSCNRFEGSIPQEIGELKAVYILNFSHNSLNGKIPWSLGNLHLLESLDLSSNKLNGVIPTQLASLTFLSFMNLSYNQLVGRIPTSTQIQSLSDGSFEGNAGLCGQPLTTNCSDLKLPPSRPPSEGNSDSGSSIDWSFLSAELGFVFGLGIIVFPLVFWKRWRVWYCRNVDNLLCKVFPHLDFVYVRSGGKNYRTLKWKPY